MKKSSIVLGFFICVVLIFMGQKKETPKVSAVPEQVFTNSGMARNVFIETDNGFGTGVIISQGAVLTCFHNLQATSEVKVNGVIPKILKVSPKYDLILLGITTSKVSPIEMATLTTQDEEVVVYGNPLGHRGTILRGRIIDLVNDKIYIDAHVFFGSSGGGVYNKKGQFVGIVSGMEGEKGFGMPFGVVIPSYTVFKFLEEK